MSSYKTKKNPRESPWDSLVLKVEETLEISHQEWFSFYKNTEEFRRVIACSTQSKFQAEQRLHLDL